MTPPDSGEREVNPCTCRDYSDQRGPGEHLPSCASLRCPECTSRIGHEAGCTWAPKVPIPLSLVQRILAALERDIWTELAAELRAIVERKT